jgi:hypothetical protein
VHILQLKKYVQQEFVSRNKGGKDKQECSLLQQAYIDKFNHRSQMLEPRSPADQI